jgi:cytochrome c biogenesis protein CcmG/thiol:disulfide interchange protein DsbE
VSGAPVALAASTRPARGRRQAIAALGAGLLAAGGSARAASGNAPPAGAPSGTPAAGPGSAPDFELPLWEVASNAPHPSRRMALAELRGRWVYLDFWASWCGPCRLSFPWMNELAQRLAAHRLSVVAIGLDTRAEPMARFIAQLAPRFTVLWDARQTTPAAYQVQAMPSSFLVDPQGRIASSHRGFTPADAPRLEHELRSRMGVA